MPKGKGKPRTDAQKTDDFKRIASKKANSAVRALTQLGSMASAKYLYTDAQVAKLKKYVADAGASCFARLEGKQTSGTGGIEL